MLFISPSNAKGKVVVGGSSSVSPVMEKLVEAYSKANTNIQVDVQTTDSTTGVSSLIVFVLFVFVSVVHPVSMTQHSIAINFLFMQVPPIPHSSMHPALESF